MLLAWQNGMTLPAHSSPDWRVHLLDSTAEIRQLLERTRRIAVLGIKTESWKPAHYVPAYAAEAGFEIVPVPVYYPEVTEILGERVYRSVSAIPGKCDLVIVFRRPVDVGRHVDDLVQAGPGAVWMQSGIRNDEAARRLAEAGIRVVQDRCAMIEHRWIR